MAVVLHDIDAQLPGPTEIHCLGGFVVAEYYGLARPTSDVDIIQVRGASDVAGVQRIAGKGRPLAKKHRVYIDIVTVAPAYERGEWLWLGHHGYRGWLSGDHRGRAQHAWRRPEVDRDSYAIVHE